MHELICGKFLGDGCLIKQENRKARFQFTHCKNDMGWSRYCYEQLSVFIPLNPPKYRRINDPRIMAGFTESYIVQSRTSEEISDFYKIWYPNSKKELPFSYIEEHFSDKTLACWYQDDGHFKQDKGIPKKIILSTDSFSAKENYFLICFLQKKYEFLFSLDSQNRLVLYDQFQILYFLKLVGPHIHQSMSRKKLVPSHPKKIAARSTIYLPVEIILKKPTLEINSQFEKLISLKALAENGNAFFKWNMTLQNKHITTKSYQIKINEEF